LAIYHINLQQHYHRHWYNILFVVNILNQSLLRCLQSVQSRFAETRFAETLTLTLTPNPNLNKP